jgi:capsular polysaccharide biosynthesis protein
LRGRLTPERALNRLSRELVTRLQVAPARCGYRYLPPVDPREFAYRQIDAPAESTAALPRNAASREELSRDVSIAGFSFYDVPRRAIAETFVATLRDVRVLTATNEWSDRHYAIVTADDRNVDVRGTGFQRAFHSRMLNAPPVHVAGGSWILEAWDRNYAHWLQWHLTKIALLQRLGMGERIILPDAAEIGGVAGASAALLGVRDAVPLAPVMRVDELTVIGMDSYRPSLLRDLRARLIADDTTPRMRKLFISRRDAERRRLLNEADVWALLEPRGYERVFMESLTFAEQIALLREARVVVALHGAGLANMLFARDGLHVVELSDVTYPNPQFYALAAALGHHYWLVPARPRGGELRPRIHDVEVDAGQVARVVEAVG